MPVAPERPAPEPDATSSTPISAFPAYKIGEIYPHPPPGWVLEVGGMVDRPARFELQDLQRLRRTDIRVRHHCVEGWTAVADWHGVRVRDIAEAVRAAGGPELDRRRIELPSPIKTIGAHQVRVRLHPEVTATIEVEIVGK